MKPRNKPHKTVKYGSVSVPIYRNAHASNKSGFAYVVAWHTPTGRKRAKFSDEAEAVKEANLRAQQVAGGKVEASSISREDREEIIAARKLAGKTPLLAALKEWHKASELTQGQVIAAAEAWKARNRSAIERQTVSEALKRFLKEKKKAGYNTEANHGSIYRDVEGSLGGNQIAQVSASMLDAYLSKIADPSTRNTHRKRIVTLWRWAQSKNLLPRDAKTEADQTSRAREHAPEVGIISPDTFGKLLEKVRAKTPEDLPALVLAGFCGLRRGEVHGQTWADVNLKEKHVRVTKAKRGTPARRLVPLSDAAIEWLMLAPDRTEDVCSGMAIDRVRKLGIDAKFTLPDNCLRHSYISHRVAETGNVPQTSLDAGNSVQIIHRHYRELVTKDEGAAWFAIKPKEKPDAEGELIPLSAAQG